MIAHWVEGTGPPVVLLHSAVGDHHLWDGVAAVLGASHTVIRYDQRGFGQSPPATSPYSQVADLAELLDRLGFDRVAVIGNSMGGRVGLQFAAAHPDRVTRLMVLAPPLPGWAWSTETQAYNELETAALDSGDLDAALQINLDMWIRGFGRSWSESLKALADKVSPSLRVALTHQLLEDHRVAEPPLDLSLVRAPTLVGVGDHDAPDFPTIATHLATQIPKASLIHFPGAGHVIPLEQPDEVARHFLKGADYSV